MRDLYVLDIETTGLGGALMGDVIVEIGIARVDIDRKKLFPEYGKIIHQDLTEQQKKSWVFENTDLDPEDVERSPWSTDDIILDLALYSQGVFTSYNRVFDFDSFLYHPPYRFHPRMAPCIKLSCADRYAEGRWFKAQEAYDLLCPDNPANVPDGKEQHRALSDAVLEGFILLRYLEDDPDGLRAYMTALEGF